MSAKSESLIWLAQRVSAVILVICVSVHIFTIIMAMNNGLSAREIIDRIDGNMGWLIFYLIFIAAIAIHAPIGIRTVLREITPLSLTSINIIIIIVSLYLVYFGSRAILGLYGFSGLIS